ncbi:hypothetical protein AK812_SmicGene41456 [Symbiodinium microadriaticum]|uniref:Uncharacterized protein n=1 Tax=Symbiodinium microadriaticum TaxID=2951 RepID=A0A1Q9C617_SYMMI|nr:hypothetical protein AK812_SmicGene41456 [Symbiodinium microadriaticum]CAE7256617.1 unnamed protein product [Symbiodinium sp. KB8]
MSWVASWFPCLAVAFMPPKKAAEPKKAAPKAAKSKAKAKAAPAEDPADVKKMQSNLTTQGKANLKRLQEYKEGKLSFPERGFEISKLENLDVDDKILLAILQEKRYHYGKRKHAETENVTMEADTLQGGFEMNDKDKQNMLLNEATGSAGVVTVNTPELVEFKSQVGIFAIWQDEAGKDRDPAQGSAGTLGAEDRPR